MVHPNQEMFLGAFQNGLHLRYGFLIAAIVVGVPRLTIVEQCLGQLVFQMRVQSGLVLLGPRVDANCTCDKYNRGYSVYDEMCKRTF